VTVPMVETTINGRWTLKLPEHRAARPVWAWWEATRLACMHHYLGQGGHVVYEIGAEEGDFPALWSSWGNDVVLFEPNERVWPNIKAIWEANDLNPPLTCFVGFAGSTDDDSATAWSGRFPACADGPVISDHGFLNLCERPDVQRTTIDKLASHPLEREPTAISIDVEGAELHVLRGAEDVLRMHRPLVWVSVHRDFMRDMYGDTPEQVDEFMTAVGYEKTPLTTDHEQHVFYWPKERELFVQ
jgi:FkbM family methyltransferase